MPTIIAIIGNGHSGSTLLDLVLSTNKAATSLGEFKHVDKELIKGKLDKIERSGMCSICGKTCDVWDNFKYEGDPYKAAFELFGTEYLVDSSKYLNWFEKSLNATKYDVKILRITRSGRDRLGSFRNRRGKLSWKEMLNWINKEKDVSRYLKKREHLRVKYEDIAQQKGLKEVCDFLGMEYGAYMWEYWKKRHHNIRGNLRTATMVQLHHGLKKKSELSDTQQKFFSKIGFDVKFISKSKYMTHEDMAMFKKLGGMEIERELGY